MPPGPPAFEADLDTASGDGVIQRIHAPGLARPDATAGGGGVLVARAAATDVLGGAQQALQGAGGQGAAGAQGAAAGAAGAAAGAQSMPDDQVEQLAGRVYWHIRDRLGAELLRDRERAGLLPDR